MLEWVSSSLCRDKSCVVFQIMPPPRDEHMSTNSLSIKSDYCDHNNNCKGEEGRVGCEEERTSSLVLPIF